MEAGSSSASGEAVALRRSWEPGLPQEKPAEPRARQPAPRVEQTSRRSLSRPRDSTDATLQWIPGRGGPDVPFEHSSYYARDTGPTVPSADEPAERALRS